MGHQTGVGHPTLGPSSGAGGSGAAVVALAEVTWRQYAETFLESQCAQLRHTSEFDDMLSTVTTGVAVDWETAGGGTIVVSTDGPGGIETVDPAGTAGQIVVRPKGSAVYVLDLRRNAWGAVCRAKILGTFAAGQDAAMVSMLNLNASFACNLGVLASNSTTFLSLWISNGTAVVGAPATTTLLIADILWLYKDVFIVYDGSFVRAYMGDFRTATAPTLIGTLEETGPLNTNPSGVASWIRNALTVTFECRVDSQLAMTELPV